LEATFVSVNELKLKTGNKTFVLPINTRVWLQYVTSDCYNERSASIVPVIFWSFVCLKCYRCP